MDKIIEYISQPETRHRLMENLTIFCVVGGIIYTIILSILIAIR
jgi:hypothetical protein